MKILPIVLLVTAAGTLAACGHHRERQPVSATPSAVVIAQPATMVVYPNSTYPGGTVLVPSGLIVQSQIPLRAGYGRVDGTLTVVDQNNVATGMRRLTLKMDDGSIQVVDTRGPEIRMGERVEITADAFIRYPLASR